MTDNQYRGGRYGKAGKSLTSDSAKRKFGKSTRAGIQGERYLSQMFSSNPATKNYMSWASLNIPRKKGTSKTYSSDLDFAIASGRTLIVIDAKSWSGGHTYWSAFGKIFKDMSVMEHRISQNMSLVVNSYQSRLPGHRVVGMTVFTPTRGGGLPTSVGLLRWPGGIKSYLPNDAIRKVSKILGDPEKPSAEIQALCGNMTQK